MPPAIGYASLLATPVVGFGLGMAQAFVILLLRGVLPRSVVSPFLKNPGLLAAVASTACLVAGFPRGLYWAGVASISAVGFAFVSELISQLGNEYVTNLGDIVLRGGIARKLTGAEQERRDRVLQQRERFWVHILVVMGALVLFAALFATGQGGMAAGVPWLATAFYAVVGLGLDDDNYWKLKKAGEQTRG